MANYFIDSQYIISHKAPLYVGGYLGRYYDVYFIQLFAREFNPKEAQDKNTSFYDFYKKF